MTGSLLMLMLAKVTVVLGIGLAAVYLARRGRAALRHLLLAATFMAALTLPLMSMAIPPISVAVPVAVAPSRASYEMLFSEPSELASGAGQPGPASAPATTAPTWRFSLSWITIVWLGVAAVFLLPLGVGLQQTRSLRRSGLPWAHGQAIAEALAIDAAGQLRVDVMLHEATLGPLTFGIFSPIILLPVDAPNWSDADLRRAIVHELEHVRRGDWVTQCVARVVCACYWFHPAVWVAWRQFVVEAERACDDAVLRRSDAAAYADQLVGLATRLSASARQPVLAMANRRDLTTRVRAVLNRDQRRGPISAQMSSAVIAASVATVLALSPLQIVAASQVAQASTPQPTSSNPAKPRYDVASIKACETEEVPTGARGGAGGTNARISPGRFTVPCVTTEQLIYLAYASYGAQDDQHLTNDDPGSASNAKKIRGGPEWVHSLKEKYTIEASAQGATERTVLMGTMLQTLLEERFKLKLHRATEDEDMLELKLAKGGLKMTPMKEGDCEPNPGDRSRVDLAAAKPRCGNLYMLDAGGHVSWSFGGHALGALARQLTSVLKVHVIDSTGINDQFVYRFEFQHEESGAQSDGGLEPRNPAGGAGQPDPSITAALEALGLKPAPSLTTALDAIGLKLEKTKGPRGYLVIDHIERPTPNEPAFAMASASAQATAGKPVSPPARAAGAGR